MTFDEILTIMNDQSRTPFQKAADLHASLTATMPSALTLTPIKERKKREVKARQPKPEPIVNGHDEAIESH